jgi:hypothetical protein
MTALAAIDLLQTNKSGPLTISILRFISLIDRLGAQDWSLRAVGAVSFVTLCIARKKRGGIDWYALLHAGVTAVGSLMCTHLDLFAAESLTGTPEPTRSCMCKPALTSLHRILPAVTMG